MKVRVKLGSRSQTILFEQQEASAVHLQDLRQSVIREFNLQDQDFQLSLNRSDALSGDDQTLDAFGIVSGDLLHIIGYSLPVDDHDTTDASSDDHTCPHSLSTVPDINRYLQEPLVIRESTERQVPVLLSQLYKCAHCSSETDALWVAIHALMLESGFLPSQTHDATTMPCDYKRSGYYMCSYNYVITADALATCSVVGVTVGASVIVHGLAQGYPDFKTEHLQLKSGDFVRTLSPDAPATYRALDKLSRMFKDTICLALINKLVTAAGLPPRQGLQALPYETKLRVTSFLDATSLCRLGQTCREFQYLYMDKTIWRILYIRTFGSKQSRLYCVSCRSAIVSVQTHLCLVVVLCCKAFDIDQII
ncbi:hypothetical protein BsWGS_11741 [Bradybaena similaris]